MMLSLMLTLSPTVYVYEFKYPLSLSLYLFRRALLIHQVPFISEREVQQNSNARHKGRSIN